MSTAIMRFMPKLLSLNASGPLSSFSSNGGLGGASRSDTMWAIEYVDVDELVGPFLVTMHFVARRDARHRRDLQRLQRLAALAPDLDSRLTSSGRLSEAAASRESPAALGRQETLAPAGLSHP
ncbi:hypothetical protein [Mesorhizobium sp. M0618]|uniref:hypothetical protein n=1 Tax=unclassified Mesorhizobium TaxID=325217 RepID=UPI00333C7ACA